MCTTTQCCGSASLRYGTGSWFSLWCGSGSYLSLWSVSGSYLFNLMRIWIFPLTFFQIWTPNAHNGPVRFPPLQWCGSGSHLSLWCGSGSLSLYILYCNLYSLLLFSAPLILAFYLQIPLGVGTRSGSVSILDPDLCWNQCEFTTLSRVL